MRIAFVFDGVYPYCMGGIPKRTYDITRKLVELGHEAHIYSMKFWDGPDVIVNEHGVYIHGVCKARNRYATPTRRSVGVAMIFTYGVARALMAGGERFDVIDSGPAPLIHHYPVRVATRMKGEAMVMTWDEVWGGYWYEYLGPLLGFWGSAVEKTVIKLPELMIAISPKIKEDLIAIGADPDKVRVVENGVDFHRIQEVKPVPGEFDVVFVGRLVPHKHVDILLKAIRLIKKEIPDIKCVVIGEGPERTRLEKMAEDLGLGENVSFLGRLEEHDDVVGYMKASKIFVLPSTREGFPNTVLEANASGLPVITVLHPKNATTAVIEDWKNGLKCRLSEEEIAEKMRLLLSDEALLAKMRSEALRFAREHDWGLMVRKLVDVYEEALSLVRSEP